MFCEEQAEKITKRNQLVTAVKGNYLGVAFVGIIVAIGFLEEYQRFWERR